LPRRSLRALFLALLLLSSSLGCRSSIEALGSSPEIARRNADGIFAAFAFRFFNVQRDPDFARGRMKIARHALTPGALFADTSIWTIDDTRDSTRAMFVTGAYENGRYLFDDVANAPYPAKIGDQRHFIQLKNLGDKNYEWYTSVDHGIGPVRAQQVAASLGDLFTAFQGRRDTELLADGRMAFPRTAKHLSQLFAIDSLRSAPLPDGSWALTLGLKVSTTRMKPGYPAFAGWLDKYVTPTIYRITLTGRDGRKYFDGMGRPGMFVMRLRSHDGRLVALDGAPTPFPDSLRISMDVSMKYKLFRVGFNGMQGDFTIERGQHEQAWQMRFTKEPSWHFPLAMNQLIRVPLRRPFEGRGLELRLGVRDDRGPQAMSTRQARGVVNESTIMRWLGNLGFSAMSDFSGKSEQEENRFWAEMFMALRRDASDVLGATAESARLPGLPDSTARR
jgi:hypothetical protein